MWIKGSTRVAKYTLFMYKTEKWKWNISSTSIKITLNHTHAHSAKILQITLMKNNLKFPIFLYSLELYHRNFHQVLWSSDDILRVVHSVDFVFPLHMFCLFHHKMSDCMLLTKLKAYILLHIFRKLFKYTKISILIFILYNIYWYLNLVQWKLEKPWWSGISSRPWKLIKPSSTGTRIVEIRLFRF